MEYMCWYAISAFETSQTPPAAFFSLPLDWCESMGKGKKSSGQKERAKAKAAAGGKADAPAADDKDVKWKKALLKKWRLVVGLKERQTAGHTLTKEQLEKITKSGELLEQLKKAGVEDDEAKKAEEIGAAEVFASAERTSAKNEKHKRDKADAHEKRLAEREKRDKEVREAAWEKMGFTPSLASERTPYEKPQIAVAWGKEADEAAAVRANDILKRKIMKEAESCDEVLDLCAKMTELNAECGSCAVFRFAKLLQSTRPARLPEGWESFCDALGTAIQSFDAMMVSKSFWAVGSMHKWSPRCAGSLASALQARTCEVIADMDPQALATVLHSLAKLEVKPAEAWRYQFETVLDGMVESFNAQDIANSLWGLAKLKWVPSTEILRKAFTQVAWCKPQFKPQEISMVLWSLATLDVDADAEMLSTLASVLDHRMRTQLTSQAVSNILWAFAKLGYPMDQRMLTAFVSQLKRCHDELTPQGFSNTVTALAKLNVDGDVLRPMIQSNMEVPTHLPTLPTY